MTREREHGGAAPRNGPGAASPALADNELLARLPPATLDRLAPHLHPVTLARHQIVFRGHDLLTAVHFPTSAVVSFVSTLGTGEALEVGLVGRDGVAAMSAVDGAASMPCDGIVQIPGGAYRIDAAVLRRERRQDEVLDDLLRRHAQLLLVRSMQVSLCNMFHAVEQRCIRWLLALHDLTGRDDLPLTHEFMATMLGVRRPTVSLVLGTLHRAGLVKEARGHLHLLDRGGLEQACCECYGAMLGERGRLLPR